MILKSVHTIVNIMFSIKSLVFSCGGGKRHLFTDTGGLLVTVQVHGANVQDRDGAPVVLASVRRAFPRMRHVFADQACSGPKLAAVLKPLGRWRVKIVKRPATAHTLKTLLHGSPKKPAAPTST